MSVSGTSAAQTRVTVVTVAYHSDAVLPVLLDSIPSATPVVVVDNGGTEGGGIADIAARFDARLVRLATNQGFGRGCNAGAARASTEFVFFVNPDAALDGGCIEALVAEADAMPGAAAFNPAITDDEGRLRFRGRSLLSERSAWVGGGPPSVTTQVPTLLGGALFCRRSAFEAVGGFDPAIFLYHEDDDLAVRLRRTAGTLHYVPAAVVRHTGGHGSGRSTGVARLKGYHMARARAYVMAKHGLILPRARTLCRAAVEFILPHNLVSARRRAKHAGQLAGAVSALRDGGAFSDA